MGNEAHKDKVTLIARKRNANESGSFDESARLINFISFSDLCKSPFLFLMKLICSGTFKKKKKKKNSLAYGCIFLQSVTRPNLVE